jgi:UDP:flavonoid glycosyltransferase YjiC (YdhE family)
MGHESWLAARDVSAVRGLGDAPFARVLQAPIWVRARGAGPTFSFGQVIAAGGFADDEGLAHLVKAWLALIELVQPAGLYGCFAPASLLAAHVARLPAARVGTSFTCPPAAGTAMMPWIRDWRPADDAVADRVVRAVCRHFGAPMLSGLAELLGAAAPFVMSWPELELEPLRRDSALYGPLGGLAAGAATDWPDGRVEGAARVLVYLPFGSAQAKPLVAALGARGWPVVWVSMDGFADELPGNICHMAEPLDMRAALAAAKLFVTRGGHGSAMDALWAGCPMLLLPDTLETVRNARALEARALGVRIDGLEQGWDAGAIGAGLDALVRENGRAAAAAHADHDPAALAALLARRMARALKLV